MEKITTKQFIDNFNNGLYAGHDVKTQCLAGWYDWFCKDNSLANKTIKLAKKLIQISNSNKFDINKTYVFFKNNRPVYGSLYDDFRIYDIETGDVLYCVVPKTGHKNKEHSASVWGKENDFNGPIVEGTWKDIKNFFNS